ncbi:MAG: S-adenosylmethionine:tRNA ribosyltransferase-isomerase [Bacteroidales bacterium]|nr:S-adenosylmethionine:tRNA ribosyltransferase-isomerase [Bacteroidales bacterium]
MKSQIRTIQIEEYSYPLPENRIAKFPLPQRDQSKLLVYQNGEIEERTFCNLPELVSSNSLMVFNNTKVIQARIHFYKESGGRIEVFCLEPHSPIDYLQSFQSTQQCEWVCMIGNLKKWKEGKVAVDVLTDAGELKLYAERVESLGSTHVVRFTWADECVTFAHILDKVGELPIPPYLNRETEEADKESYQTVYSKIEGSVAAPTAGLHFTKEVFDNLNKKGVICDELTLHVGAGTFKPVKSATIGDHEMHTEFISVNMQLIDDLLNHSHVIAVGTTSVRTLESLYYIGYQLHFHPQSSSESLKVTQWMPYSQEYTLSVNEALQAIRTYFIDNKCDTLVTSTQIMIVPGFNFRIVEGIVTNFHQPASTLLLLVSAFVNGDWRTIYDYALAHDFRFLSYGDSSILLR